MQSVLSFPIVVASFQRWCPKNCISQCSHPCVDPPTWDLGWAWDSLKIMELGRSDLCMSFGPKPSGCLVASFLTLLEPWSSTGCLAMLLEKPRVQTTGSCHEEGRDPEAIWRGERPNCLSIPAKSSITPAPASIWLKLQEGPQGWPEDMLSWTVHPQHHSGRR